MPDLEPIVCEIKDADRFLTNAAISDHHIIFDEPEGFGGTNKGPGPEQMAVASLGACVAMTIKIYLDHKQWTFETIRCSLRLSKEKIGADREVNEKERSYVRNGILTRIVNVITIGGELDEEQLKRIRMIAGKCPVHRLMEGSTLIEDEVQLA